MATVPDVENADRYIDSTPVSPTTDFDIPWPVIGNSLDDAKSNLRVLLVGEEELEQDDFIFNGNVISGVAGVYNGGTISLVNPVSNQRVIIWSDRAPRRTGNFLEGKSLPFTTLDALMDDFAVQERDAYFRIKAAVSYPVEDVVDGVSNILPPKDDRAGKIAVYDASTGAQGASNITAEQLDGLLDDVTTIHADRVATDAALAEVEAIQAQLAAGIGLWSRPFLGFKTASQIAGLTPSIGDRYVQTDSTHANEVAEYAGLALGWLYSGAPTLAQTIKLANGSPYIFNGTAWLTAGRLNVLDFGCALDGTTDDTTIFQAVLTACGALGGGTVEIPYTSGGMKCLGTLHIPAGVKLSGIGGKPTLNFPNNNITTLAISVEGSHVSISGFNFTFLSGTCVIIGADSVTDFELADCVFTDSNPAASGSTFKGNRPGVQNHRFKDLVINGGGYGIQYNTGATGTGVFITNITGNAIGSDCISMNVTDGQLSDILVLGGSISQANAARTGLTSGFAVGLACTKNVRIIGLRVRDTRNEAIHIEQGSENVLIDACDINLTSGVSGVQIIGNNTTPTKRVTVSNCRIEGNSTGVRGIYVVGDNTQTTGHNFHDNTITNCNSVGIILSYEISQTHDNKISNCPTGINTSNGIALNPRVRNNEFDNCTTSVYGSGGTVGRTVLTGTLPARVGPAGFPLTVHEISHSISGAVMAPGAYSLSDFVAPGRFLGKASFGVLAQSAANNYSAVSYEAKYDGTTWSSLQADGAVDMAINRSIGSIGSVALTVAAGVMQLSANNSSGSTNFTVSAYIDLFGEAIYI